MNEGAYQSKIIAKVEEKGGFAVNGKYTKAGIPDLICGLPMDGDLLFVAIEVKTPENYDRVMRAITFMDGEYHVFDRPKLKDHEVLQMENINKIRRLGGRAIFAHRYEQVARYVYGSIS